MASYLKIIAAMLIWSTWGPMIRWIALPPTVVLFATSLVASFTVPLVLAIRGDLSLTGISKERMLFLLLAIASIANNISYFYALDHTTISNAVFTHYTAPIFVALLAPLIISERIQKITLISLPMAVSGMIMIVLSGDGFRLGESQTAGILAGTASGVAYAFIIIFSRKLSQMLMHHKAVVLLPWMTTVALAPLVLMGDHAISLKAWILLITTGIFHSTLAPLLYYNALRKVLAQHAAILGYMEPLAAIPAAYFVLSETPSRGALIGGVMILISGYFVIHSRLRSPA
jgi:drug/metabolite transporter (DMT)-like permease